MNPRSDLRELGQVFLKLGLTGFGGPAAHIALMEQETVQRRTWMSRTEFLDLVSAANLIPGPNSTELALHIGRERGGWKGLIVAGVSFILPAMLIVLFLAWMYVQYGHLPQAEGLLYGVKPVILAIVLTAIWNLIIGWKNQPGLVVTTIVCMAARLIGASEIPLMLAAGLGVWATRQSRISIFKSFMILFPVLAFSLCAVRAFAETISSSSIPYSDSRLFFFFAKVGGVLYGSGYALLAFLESDLIHDYGWLSRQQLMDAIAIGQFTPGPVFTTATFIGYLLGGVRGACVSTVGIFLPAFLYVAVSRPWLAYLKSRPHLRGALDGFNCASLALLITTTVNLAQTAVVDFTTAIMTVFCSLILLTLKINSVWLVLAGAVLGLGVHYA